MLNIKILGNKYRIDTNSRNHTYAYIHRNKGHAFVAVTEDFDVTSTNASPLISSFGYIQCMNITYIIGIYIDPHIINNTYTSKFLR